MSAPVLLVHGAWGGAWAWGFVQAELEKLGVQSTAIDMPTRSDASARLADDAAAVRSALEQFGRPAVVVGHSWAGVTITEASAGNDRVKHLVYTCAVLPEEGMSTGAYMAEDPTPSKIGDIIRATDDGMSTVDPDGAREVLFNDVSAEVSGPIIDALGQHVLAVFGEAPTALGWKEHPSTYILTTEDRVFSPELQRRMAANAGTVVEVEAGHIPVLARAAEVARAIADAARA